MIKYAGKNRERNATMGTEQEIKKQKEYIEKVKEIIIHHLFYFCKK